MVQFPVPRQTCGDFLSLTDYFAPAGSGVRDIAALQLVTVGRRAVERVQELNAKGNLVDAFFAHGLAVQLTETAARWVHGRIRGELGLGQNQGRRYSWGYTPIPDLSQEIEVVRLLNAKEFLDIELTSGYQFVPEFSTAALVVHHPQAVYFRIDA
jgi:5-methyltetrahydrofolate--homocysteine methyltransferase